MDDGEGPAVGPLKTSDTMGNDREPIATVASMLGLGSNLTDMAAYPHWDGPSQPDIDSSHHTSPSITASQHQPQNRSTYDLGQQQQEHYRMSSSQENLCMMEMVDGNFSSHEVDELMGRIGQQARPSFSEQQQNELFQAESDFMQNQSSPLVEFGTYMILHKSPNLEGIHSSQFDMGTDLSNPSLTSSNMDEFSALMAQATYPSAYGHSVNTSTHHSPITSHSNAVSPNTSHSNPVSPQMLHMASPPSLHSTMYEPSATYAITRQSSSSSVQTSPHIQALHTTARVLPSGAVSMSPISRVMRPASSFQRGSRRASPARKALIRAASVGGPIRNLTSTSMVALPGSRMASSKSTAPILLRNKPSSFSAPTSPTAATFFAHTGDISSPRPSAQSSSSSTPVASPAASPMQRPLTSGSIVTSPSSSISSSPKPSALTPYQNSLPELQQSPSNLHPISSAPYSPMRYTGLGDANLTPADLSQATLQPMRPMEVMMQSSQLSVSAAISAGLLPADIQDHQMHMRGFLPMYSHSTMTSQPSHRSMSMHMPGRPPLPAPSPMIHPSPPFYSPMSNNTTPYINSSVMQPPPMTSLVSPAMAPLTPITPYSHPTQSPSIPAMIYHPARTGSISSVSSSPSSSPSLTTPLPPNMTPLRHRAVLVTAAAEHHSPRLSPHTSSPTHTSSSSPKTPYIMSHHRVSDQRRREDLKSCFDNLLTILPPPLLPTSTAATSHSTDSPTSPHDVAPTTTTTTASTKPPNRVEIMARTLDYIMHLKGRLGQLDGKIEGLKGELQRVKIEKGIVAVVPDGVPPPPETLKKDE